ncbi:MAG: bacillithiol biosynthesis cysteine-adding enzyme BshC [Gemmatimonadota bacterium]
MNRTTKVEMELIVSRPRGAPVVRDYLDHAAGAEEFFLRTFDRLADFESKAAEVDARFDTDARERAAEALMLPEGFESSRVEAFVREGGYMVTTGQQPGLFGGPLYSIFKAITAVRLAETLEARLGRPVLPVFWVASDDHDWAEADHADLIGTDNELHRFSVRSPEEERTSSLHRLTLGADADEAVAAFLDALPDSDFSASYTELVRSGFGQGSTLPEGFHQLMHRTLGRLGIAFTDAAHEGVKTSSRELLLAELGHSERMESVLADTVQRLEAAGYGVQVPLMPGGVNLFLEGPAGRERVYRDGEGFRLRTSGEQLTFDEIVARVEADPKALSPNVLMRPVVESAVFPTLAYVGGPGEMAYFAQLRAYFEAHSIEMPIVFPRWSAAPIERKIGKVLGKFDLEPADLARPFHEVASDFAREEVPGEVRAAIGTLRGALGSGAGELQKAAAGVDPTLKGPVQNFRSQAMAALSDVEKKVLQAVKRESDIALQQIEKAQLHLYPNGKPAERVQSPLYYLSRYGDDFVDQAYAAFEVNFD